MLNYTIMIAMEQLQPTPQELDARTAANIREGYGLPVDATNEEVRAAADARTAANIREGYGLPVDATNEEVRAAADARTAASRLGGTALQ
jgi:hypothetical protein